MPTRWSNFARAHVEHSNSFEYIQSLIAPGAKVHYVRSSALTTDPYNIETNRYSTLNAALEVCRANSGDIVAVLPSHTENVSTADQMTGLVAGTRIIGFGNGNQRPTFTWSAATATFLLDKAGCTIENCILQMEGGGAGTALTVAAPITVSAAGCGIMNCLIKTSHDADEKSTIAVTTTAAADDFTLYGNHFYGATAGECTTVVQLVGADRLKMINNRIFAATSSATVGVVRFLTTASTDIEINGLVAFNNKASSTVAITGMAGLTGTIDNVLMGLQINDNRYANEGGFDAPTDLAIGSNVRTDVNV